MVPLLIKLFYMFRNTVSYTEIKLFSPKHDDKGAVKSRFAFNSFLEKSPNRLSTPFYFSPILPLAGQI